ncbi:MAG TPA: 2-oxo-4-hydroxy-4-carboxy-5-ureidoimidazoline decarboxylase [Nocardioides sp.]|uniref:2-oxo-4-hydroxy-4-carboxy-5-ureidoimidazoline decarboxylase n=1 Tax=Nocardioides sp. TaxID=35761 RepID=UPI002E3297D3|nr:2-oxo-4-hydroxy-4-carboxy-5-ureidoimidazoline decarboxylase [Nocardioides sp.]HEX5089293.1 2-oxo-4-hydroxy-4-carboxy-5-ureidoimidazoline decarboxylase [Nocardioides sp.]
MSTTTTAAKRRPRHPVDEVLPAQQLAVYGLQHVFAFYAGAVVVPILLAGAIGLNQSQLIHLINADLFTCGIASILQSVGVWKIGVRLPLLQGVTFTAVSPMIIIGLDHGGGADSLTFIYGAVIVAGIFQLLIAPYFSRLVRFFPPVVTGSVITIIGITLIPVAAYDAGGGQFALYNPDLVPENMKFGSATNLSLAFFTIVVILLITRYARGFLATIAVLAGLVIGTAVAAFVSDGSGGKVAEFDSVKGSDWVGFTGPFHFGAPQFALVPILLMIVVMLITAVETTGDVYATGQIVEKPIGKSDIAAALRADGLATFLGGVMNSFPYTCFAENVGLVRLTRVKSRWVVATAGGIMILLGLVPKAGALVSSIPSCVLGGAALVMFGTVAAVGIQTLGRVDFHNHRNIMIVAVSLGVAMIPVALPQTADGQSVFLTSFPDNVQAFLNSGITVGSVTAILLNLFLNYWGGSDDTGKPDHELINITVLNTMTREEFIATVAPAFQGTSAVAGAAADRRPFADANALRATLQDELFSLPAAQQDALMHSYPALAGEELRAGDLGENSVIDQASAGLTFLGEEHQEAFNEVTRAYEEKFGFPLIIAVRELSAEQVLEQAWNRLDNSPTQEHAAALLEIAKIANHRLADVVADTAPMGSQRAASLQRVY